ncbi:MAG TPA: PPOX class F420-dependent oxidoreductase [Acidimicrobiales bacterium]|nr:PPOX class F420-dependent oxidoreductase [Acidimicrobiales bacterium]
MPLDPETRAMAQDKNFATMTTLLPSGYPMTHVMWVDADDEHLLINTEVHRDKYKNVQRDPRVSVTIIDRTNPYKYAEVRGKVVEEIRGPEARDDIDRLSRKYNGTDYDPSMISSERVILKIKPVDKKIKQPE